MAKHLAIVILLSILITGLGQIYLGYAKRGIIILITGVTIAITLNLFLPYPLPLIGFVYWIWQIIDATMLYKKIKGRNIIDNNKLICFKCHSENQIDTQFCVNCGSALQVSCPKCGNTNLQTSKFCAKCGNKIIN